jgi:hypothetical protein
MGRGGEGTENEERGKEGGKKRTEKEDGERGRGERGILDLGGFQNLRGLTLLLLPFTFCLLPTKPYKF